MQASLHTFQAVAEVSVCARELSSGSVFLIADVALELLPYLT